MESGAQEEKEQEAATESRDDADGDQKDENDVQGDETKAATEEGEQLTEEGVEETSKKAEERILLDDFFYDYEDLCSKPFISPESGIPENLLTFVYSFGYDCTRRVNIQLIDKQTIMFVAGNLVILMNIMTKKQNYIRSSSGGGIGIVMVHPSGNYFAVGEKGVKPHIIVYEYPSLKPYRILRGGTEEAYAFTDFNPSGSLLASVGGNPDYMITIWNWKQEQTVLRSKAFSQDVYRVTFSLENEEQLTTSGTGHIKFWKMVETFTGLKLQGQLGRFGKTALTDIEGYVELPDGKVVSGSEWGNMLLWDNGLIKVELCRRDGKTCHHGSINQFVLDEGELITVGADGCVRVWDFETIDSAESYDEDCLAEMEPMNELVVGRTVNFRFMVKFKDSNFIWCAQDANGRIWKLDLSFSNITQDPECLFSFHSGEIQAMDLSPLTYLMATTALDHTVRIYDFVRNEVMTNVKYRQGGTALTWAPLVLYPKGNMIVVGFEDGVIRILEIYNPKGLALVAGRTQVGEAEIRLKQALKPHTADVTAIAYENNGRMLATGSIDNTVFFFLTGDQYAPVGFINVPGPVVSLQWSPPSYEKDMLLIFCENGYVVQTAFPDLVELDTSLTFEIPLHKEYFRFNSIRSSIERNIEIKRRKLIKEQKEKEKQERLKKKQEMAAENPELATEEEEEEEEEKEEELPMIYIPEEPSPILCGFYSKPGSFWLSVGGYDCGYLYHCHFTADQGSNQDVSKRTDEPFVFLTVEDASETPIRKMLFNSKRQLLFCGMENGAVRIYPLSFNDYDLKSMKRFWSLNIHDNDYGHIKHICTSHDDQFLVTCGADGNIFAFSILPQEDIVELMRGKRGQVPSPRRGLERDKMADDIDDPHAYSLENAKQKAEMDLIMKLAEEKKAKKRMELDELRDEFKELQTKNAELPEHVQLNRANFELDQKIRDRIKRQITERIELVYKEMAWEQEKYRIGLQKLQTRFRNTVEFDLIVVHCFESDHKVSTYRVTSLSEKYYQLKTDMLRRSLIKSEQRSKEDLYRERRGSGIDKDETKEKDVEVGLLEGSQLPQAKMNVGRQQADRLQKMINKTDKAKAKIDQRKKEWKELHLSRPDDNYEDPNDVAAIKEAQENMGDFKLKTAADYTVPEHLRINAEKKRNQLIRLEELIHELKVEMSRKIVDLRDTKLDIVEQITSLTEELRSIQAQLDPSQHLPIPIVPSLYPDETPEKKFQCDKEKLLEFKEEHAPSTKRKKLSDQLSEGGKLTETAAPSEAAASMQLARNVVKPPAGEAVPLSNLEAEINIIEEKTNVYLQAALLRKINELIQNFDAELRVLCHQKCELDIAMKMADLRHVTLFEEVLLLKEFEKSEDILQERVNQRISERLETQIKAEECLQQVDAKKRDLVKLQEKEKALHATFQMSLGENNKNADFLTRVFKKKIKRTKKGEAKMSADSDEESDDESDEEFGYSSDEDESGSDDGGVDDSACPDTCDPALFVNTLQLREKRLDIEEALAEQKKILELLKKEHDVIAKKVKVVEGTVKSAKEDLEALQREKQQKLNELYVVVPLKLHQVEYIVNGDMPNDLVLGLVFTNPALMSLQKRIRELQVEKDEQQELYKQARQQHVQLLRDKAEMEAEIAVLEEKCYQEMILKFGRVVDLEALQTLSVNVALEELKGKVDVNQTRFHKEMKQREDKMSELQTELTDFTRQYTCRLDQLNMLTLEKKNIETHLNTQQKKMGVEIQKQKAKLEERQALIQKVEKQAQEIDTLKDEIGVLVRKGGHILPPALPPLPQ